MTTCLVTGGAGFIGSHIVDALAARGDKVRVLDNLSTGHRQNLAHLIGQIEFIEGDLRNDAAVRDTVTDVDLVFHLAAMVSVPESMAKPLEAEDVNALGTLRLLSLAAEAGVRRLVLSSTCAVYGDEPTLPKTEVMAPQPKSPYAISKLAAENYCCLFNDSFGLETVVLRYFNVFGPRQDPSSAYSGVISIFVDKMMRGEVPLIFGDGEQTRDFVFVKDVVRANLLAAHKPKAAGQRFNIGTERQITINHLFRILSQIFKLDINPIYQPSRSGDIRYSYADASRAKTMLDWTAQVSFELGLSHLVDSVITSS
ncbi:MAG: SDR family oxidoreductase [Anaerolineae bacterium]|nr:SDR family oxidoreductase [Anaerolineae bacterium]MCB9105174.1 SDR family oxidoreductase [Anaerolineales bacterium]